MNDPGPVLDPRALVIEAYARASKAYRDDGFELDGFKTKPAAGVAAAKFDNVKRLVVTNSPVLEVSK